uniref:Pentapeptide repeat-containing protein n=1 Tax=Lactuca sativa TaxID=4236 RepID=A0A9R1UDK7_LACSA|nr:hypothetical protein LSAT_V11C900500920 [Lactuca sativa]
MDTKLTRTDIIKCVQSEKLRLRGVNLSGLDLFKLDVDAENTVFHNATLRECEFTWPNLRGSLLAGANLQSANLQGKILTVIYLLVNSQTYVILDACLVDCCFCGAHLCSAYLQTADLTNANLEGANMEGANLTI